MKISNGKILSTGAVLCTAIYLFVTAPSELPDGDLVTAGTNEVSAEQIFNSANSINDAARFIYTKQIVGPGSKAGLKFGEDWADPGVEKGPLPALFLRLVAGRMETKPEPLGLYLGSDEPINASNLFSGKQMEQFEIVKNSVRRVSVKQKPDIWLQCTLMLRLLSRVSSATTSTRTAPRLTGNSTTSWGRRPGLTPARL